MPLPTFKTLEEIPEAVRSGYVQKGDEFVPDVEDVSGLKSAFERQKADAKAAKERAKQLEEELEQRKKGVTDEQIAARRKEIEDAQKPLLDKLAETEARLRTVTLTDRVKAMYANAGFLGDKLDDVMALTQHDYDLSADGTPIVKADPTMQLSKHIEKIVAKYPEWVRSKQKGGTQFPGSGPGGPSEDLSKLLTTNPQALIEYANAQKK